MCFGIGVYGRAFPIGLNSSWIRTWPKHKIIIKTGGISLELFSKGGLGIRQLCIAKHCSPSEHLNRSNDDYLVDQTCGHGANRHKNR